MSQGERWPRLKPRGEFQYEFRVCVEGFLRARYFRGNRIFSIVRITLCSTPPSRWADASGTLRLAAFAKSASTMCMSSWNATRASSLSVGSSPSDFGYFSLIPSPERATYPCEG